MPLDGSHSSPDPSETANQSRLQSHSFSPCPVSGVTILPLFSPVPHLRRLRTTDALYGHLYPLDEGGRRTDLPVVPSGRGDHARHPVPR